MKVRGSCQFLQHRSPSAAVSLGRSYDQGRQHQLQQKINSEQERKKKQAEAKRARERVVVKTYTGSQNKAASLFQQDAAKMAEQGYFPTSQTWAPGRYGCGAFVLALILFIVLIGIIVFLYMLIVPPAGTLTVT